MAAGAGAGTTRMDTGGLLLRFTTSGGGDSSVDPDDVLCDPGRHAPAPAPALAPSLGPSPLAVSLDDLGGMLTMRASEPAMLMAVPGPGRVVIGEGSWMGRVPAWLNDGDMGDTSDPGSWLTCETGETAPAAVVGARLLVLTARAGLGPR